MDSRTRGLGLLAVLPDELIDHLFRTLDTRALAVLGCVSKVLRIFACEEPLWQELHLARCKRPFEYKGSWRATYLAFNPDCRRPECTAADLSPAHPVPGFSSMFLYRRWYRGRVDLASFLPEAEAVPRVDAAELSEEEFEARYDAASQPVLLQGLARVWAVEEWAPARLAATLGDRRVKVTKPSGGSMRMVLREYLQYSAVQHDEEPVYVFDAGFGETAPELLGAYAPPALFRWDLFAHAGYARDEYRWLVAGPPRSGASWHVDPAATSAWNTLLLGRKRWALYPPDRVPPGVAVHVHASGEPGFQTPTSLQWFLEVYPQLPPERRPLEVVQQPGETIFLPAGWWHCVLNLDMTVAVTQNFVSPANLEKVVAYLSLGAGTLFDQSLVPSFLEQRRGTQQQRQQGGERQEQAGEGGEAYAAAVASPGSPLSSSGATYSTSGTPSSSSSGATQADAAAHLRGAVLGLERGGILGRWLRAMWAAEPSLRPRLAELAGKYTEVEAWRRRLGTVCAAAGLPSPQPEEGFPLAGGEALVFQVGDCIVKFFNTRLYPPGLAAWQMEAAAYHSMRSTATERAQQPHATNGSGSSDGVPRLLGIGLLEDNGEGLLGASAEQPSLADTACSAGAPASAPAEGAEQQQSQQQQGSSGGHPVFLPYLVVSRAPGATLGSLQECLGEGEWQEVAAAAGRALADFHALPLPRGALACAAAAEAASCGRADAGDLCACGRNSSVGSVPRCTAWASHDGVAWGSQHGRVDSWKVKGASGSQAAAAGEVQGGTPRGGTLLPPRLRLFPAVPLGAILPLAGSQSSSEPCSPVEPTAKRARLGRPGKAPAAPQADAGAPSPARDAAAVAWGPFLSFLSYRRQRVLRGGTRGWEGILPPHLAQQVEAYLPQDPALLVGLGSSAAAGSAPSPGLGALMPTWVHGDLTAENLLLSPEGAWGESSGRAGKVAQGASAPAAGCSVTLIDFADGGQGDPLWDIVPLYIRSFRCNPNALRHCLTAYRQRQQEQQRQRQRPGDSQPAALNARHGAQALPPGLSMLAPRWARSTALPEAPANPSPAPAPILSLSYVATVYTLLHELDLVESAIKRQPQLWEAPSLPHLQRVLWGALDEQLQ